MNGAWTNSVCFCKGIKEAKVTNTKTLLGLSLSEDAMFRIKFFPKIFNDTHQIIRPKINFWAIQINKCTDLLNLPQ
jgi:hypothetical protein